MADGVGVTVRDVGGSGTSDSSAPGVNGNRSVVVGSRKMSVTNDVTSGVLSSREGEGGTGEGVGGGEGVELGTGRVLEELVKGAMKLDSGTGVAEGANPDKELVKKKLESDGVRN